MKRKLNVRLQRKLLSEAALTKNNIEIHLILDSGDGKYYLSRAREIIAECLLMAFGDKVNQKLRVAQTLLNIVRLQCVQKTSKDTGPKVKKQSSKRRSSNVSAKKVGLYSKPTETCTNEDSQTSSPPTQDMATDG